MHLVNTGKRLATLVLIFLCPCLFLTAVTHAQLSITKPTKASFLNRWKNSYLAFQQQYFSFMELPSGNAVLSEKNNDSWELLPVPSMPGNVWIKVIGKEFYLNVEKGLSVSPIQPNWHSAMWRLEKVAGTEYYRIINHWKAMPLHNQNGNLELSNVPDGAPGAMWKLGINQPQQKYSVGKAYFIVEEADDGGTDPAIYGLIQLQLLKNGTEIRKWNILTASDAAGSRVVAPEKQKQVFAISNASHEVDPNDLASYTFKLSAQLWDYDMGANPDDNLGFLESSVRLDQLTDPKKELGFTLTGEGKVKVSVTIYKGDIPPESIKDKMQLDPQTDVRWIPLNYESVELAAAKHINGLAVDNFGTHTFVNFPYVSALKGDILFSKTGQDWTTTTFNLKRQEPGNDRYPSGMQIDNNLLVVADNKCLNFFYFANEKLVELPDLLLEPGKGNDAETAGIVYNPYHKRYIVCTRNKAWCSPANISPMVNGVPNSNFHWSELTFSGSVLSKGEAGLAILYDEVYPNKLIVLSLGAYKDDNSYTYNAAEIYLDLGNLKASFSDHFLSKKLEPPAGYDRTGSGPSFRWGGTANVTNGSVFIYAAPKRLDNVAWHSSDLIRWSIW